MKKITLTALLVLLPLQVNAFSLEAWWELCRDKTAKDSTCLLSISSMEGGIKAQAVASAVDHQDQVDRNDKFESASWLGFCWDASMKDNWQVKYQLFKGHVAEVYHSDADKSVEIAFKYRAWFSDRYHPAKCLIGE